MCSEVVEALIHGFEDVGVVPDGVLSESDDVDVGRVYESFVNWSYFFSGGRKVVDIEALLCHEIGSIYSNVSPSVSDGGFVSDNDNISEHDTS